MTTTTTTTTATAETTPAHWQEAKYKKIANRCFWRTSFAVEFVHVDTKRTTFDPIFPPQFRFSFFFPFRIFIINIYNFCLNSKKQKIYISTTKVWCAKVLLRARNQTHNLTSIDDHVIEKNANLWDFEFGATIVRLVRRSLAFERRKRTCVRMCNDGSRCVKMYISKLNSLRRRAVISI